MTVGARVAAARHARGMSLEDLAHRTRIPVSGLRALEADAHDRLPPPPYARGYVRACALELGLDPQALLAQFDAERPPVPVPDVPPAAAPESIEPAAVNRLRRVVSMVIAASVVALVIWSGREQSAVTNAVEPAAAVVAAETPVATTGALPVDPPRMGGVAIVLRAERECWVTAVSDGERAVYRLMRAGDRETVRATERIRLRVGDAGAITLSVNEGAPRLVGPSGAVRTLVVTPGDRWPVSGEAPAAPAQGN
jgi:transcriptional regulator with XRE-family HTH domain